MNGEAINHAVDSILHNWEEWSADAGQAAQIKQDGDAWFDVMRGYLTRVIREVCQEERRYAGEPNPYRETT